MNTDFTISEFVAWIGRTADYLNHSYDASQTVADHLRSYVGESVEQNFENARTPLGEKWLPVKRRVPPPPLVRSGDMKLAAIEAAYGLVADNASLYFDTSSLPSYWVYQQYGTSTIPPREFLGFPPDFLDRAADVIAEDMIEKIQTR